MPSREWLRLLCGAMQDHAEHGSHGEHADRHQHRLGDAAGTSGAIHNAASADFSYGAKPRRNPSTARKAMAGASAVMS
jgi:hypothetical protein